MLKKLFSHSFLYAIGPQVPRLVNLLILPIITKYLTPLDYGIYGTLLAYTGILQGIRSLGFDVLLVNSFFKKINWKSYWDRYFGGLYIYNILFSIVFVYLLLLFIPEEAQTNKWLLIFLIVLPAALFDTTKMFGSRYFQLSQKPRYIALVSAIVGIITIFINLYVIAYLKLGYLGWFISTAIGSFISFCCYFYPLFFTIKIKPTLTFNKNFWNKSLKVALPTIPHNYSAYLLNSSDRLVMDQLKTPIEQIGIYNLAYVFGGYLEMFGEAIGMAVGPYYSKLYSKKTVLAEKQVKTFTFFLQISFIVLSTSIALWAKQIFELLISNSDLEAAYPISIIIIMGYAYRPMYWASANKLFFHEKTNKLWRVTFFAGTLNVALNFIFIPQYGIMAAAVSTFISLLFMGFAFFGLNDYKKLNNQKMYPVLWLFIIIAATVFVYLLKDVDIIIKAAITICILSFYLIYFLKAKNELNKIEV